MSILSGEILYVQFGINLSIPDLFVAGFEEGNFENLTGQTYGDLDNLCQNSRNHFDNIDSKVKPSNVIVDVINMRIGLHKFKAFVLSMNID